MARGSHRPIARAAAWRALGGSMHAARPGAPGIARTVAERAAAADRTLAELIEPAASSSSAAGEEQMDTAAAPAAKRP